MTNTATFGAKVKEARTALSISIHADRCKKQHEGLSYPELGKDCRKEADAIWYAISAIEQDILGLEEVLAKRLHLNSRSKKAPQGEKGRARMATDDGANN